MTVIVELGVGNTPSIQNMLQHVGIRSELTRNPQVIRDAKRLILPGVGAWDAGCNALVDRELVAPIQQAADDGTPILGICLGMQLLATASEEGNLTGLGLVESKFKRFPRPEDGFPLKVPHIGWNRVLPRRRHPLFDGFEKPGRFYFVHSYYADAVPQDQLLATTDYGVEFASAFGHGNVMGVQFHPEKSHIDGMRLLKNFAKVPHGT